MLTSAPAAIEAPVDFFVSKRRSFGTLIGPVALIESRRTADSKWRNTLLLNCLRRYNVMIDDRINLPPPSRFNSTTCIELIVTLLRYSDSRAKWEGWLLFLYSCNLRGMHDICRSVRAE